MFDDAVELEMTVAVDRSAIGDPFRLPHRLTTFD